MLVVGEFYCELDIDEYIDGEIIECCIISCGVEMVNINKDGVIVWKDGEYDEVD